MDAQELMNLTAAGRQYLRGPACGVATVLKVAALKEPQEVLEALQAVIDNEMASPARVVAYLGGHGYQVSAWTLRRHRRRNIGEGCACP